MTYLLFMLPALILSFYAQSKVKSTFHRYSQIRASRGYTGAQVASTILRNNGIGSDVKIEKASGTLTDHYDPRSHTVKLSQSVYDDQSIAAIGVAAHEVGHAIQHSQSYGPLALRHKIVPLTNIASSASFPVIFVGFILQSMNLILVGVILFSIVVLFHLVTLPVELNASRRAIIQLSDTGLVSAEELPGVKRVLSAAAFTYVAATLSSVATLLYYLTFFLGRDDS
ncbi:MAG: zinc metallopeptidase [Syntrophomonadaceae bacterium]|jgi:Zn-dependent membrane protease YugP|nr:zinc metallopeptidase [Syntrophomonadaceae bacterium]